MGKNVPAEDYDDEPNDMDRDSDRRSRDEAKARRQLERGRIARLFDSIGGGAARPGEQDVVRSPVVMVLFGSTIAVTLLAALFLFMYFSENESRRLKQCMTALEQQKYSEAEKLFVKFLESYSKSKSGDTARIGLHRTRVEKHIMTATVDVVSGLQELDEMVRIGRELNGFEEQKDNIRRYADRLTFAGARVAELSQKQEHLDVSLKAMEILKRFSPENVIPKDREEELIRRQRIAEAAILKKTVFEDAKKQIRSFLEAGNTAAAVTAREDLIKQYDVFRDDKEIAQLLTDILKREQELTVRSDVGLDAKVDDPNPTVSGLSLTLRTSSVTDLVSQGQLVFSFGIDSCIAVDTVTGEPKWKRVIGTSPAFAPILVNGSEPGVLVHNSDRNELVLLSQKDGRLLWRQSLPARPSGQPLLFEQQIYLTLDSGELWQLAAATGRALSSIKFSQKIIGPPTLSRDSTVMFIPGDQMFVYTLSVTPFACQAVSYINFRAGSVEAPMLTAGGVVVLFDNDTPAACRIRVLAHNTETGLLTVRATETVDGQVRDPSLLWGEQLFVPSSPQRITVFQISDDADQAPLSSVGSNQLEDGVQTRMFLMAGSGRQLWLGGRDLRKFNVRTNSLILDSAVTAQGIHTLPLQDAGENVYITSHDPTLSSVFLTCADREQMKGIWRTVLGTNVVAVAGSVNEGSLIAVGDFGKVFRTTLTDIQKGGFLLESTSEFRLPDKLASSVDGLVTLDNRLAAYCGAPEPAVWTISTVGQLERRWNLPDVPQGKPVAIAAGIVMPLPGRLHLTATRDGNPAEDYRAAQAAGEVGGWKSLTALSDTMVLAINNANDLIRVEYRSAPRPQLAEVGISKIEHPVELAPAAEAGLLYLATADGHLMVLQSNTLEVLADVEVGGIPSMPPRISGKLVFQEVGGTELKIFRVENGLVEIAKHPLSGRSLVGAPMAIGGNRTLAAFSDGSVIRFTADGTVDGEPILVGQNLKSGPFLISGQPLLLGIDGSLHIVPADAVK